MDKILEKEEKYNLWDFKIDSLNLWPLIRSSIFSKYEIKKRGYSKPHYISNKYNVLSPKLWKHHLKTIYLLNIRRDCFDILFFSTAAARYFNKGKKIYENRLYERYFESFYKSLNFESSYRGFFPNVLPKSENTFIFETLNILIKLSKEINRHRISNVVRHEIMLFSKAVNIAFPNLISIDYMNSVITKNIISFPIIKQFYFNNVIPRIKNKIVFIHCASYLGSMAVLTKIFHSAGFKVVEVQHGFTSKEDYPYNYPPSCTKNSNHGCREYLPDYLLMFGDYWAERVCTPSKKIVVGYPYLNELSEKLIQKNTPELKTILIVSQGTVSGRMVKIAKKLSQAFSDYKIIFKLHPGEIPFIERYSSLKNLSNIEIIGNYNIFELIAKNKIIIGYNSTTLVEALKFPEKRIFILENNDVPNEIGYKFSNVDELIEAIKDNSKGFPKAKPEYFWASNWEERFREFMKKELNYKM